MSTKTTNRQSAKIKSTWIHVLKTKPRHLHYWLPWWLDSRRPCPSPLGHCSWWRQEREVDLWVLWRVWQEMSSKRCRRNYDNKRHQRFVFIWHSGGIGMKTEIIDSNLIPRYGTVSLWKPKSSLALRSGLLFLSDGNVNTWRPDGISLVSDESGQHTFRAPGFRPSAENLSQSLPHSLQMVTAPSATEFLGTYGSNFMCF